MDESRTLLADLDESLAATTVDPRDCAVVNLARKLAWTIDADPDQLEGLAPKLLACLSALGLTVASRKEVKAGEQRSGADDALDELRDRRGRRAR